MASSSSKPLVSSNKRRRSRVSWMIECSPYITTTRGSSSKARRSICTKTDLDTMFNDIPQDGSPLPLHLLQELNIKTPELSSPMSSLEIKQTPEGGVKDDNICTNLMSLLAAESPGAVEPASAKNTTASFNFARKRRMGLRQDNCSPLITKRHTGSKLTATMYSLHSEKRGR